MREYDAVVGRWTSTDPYAQYWSPYVGMGNEPVGSVDPDGGCTDAKGNYIPCGAGVQSDGFLMPEFELVSKQPPWRINGFTEFYVNNRLNYYMNDPFQKSLGINSEFLNYIRQRSENEAIDIMKAKWASDQSGVDPGSLNFFFNPLARALYYSSYSSTVSDADEGYDLLGTVAFDVGLSWLGKFQMSNPGGLSAKPLRGGGGKINGFTISSGSSYGAKPRFDVHPLGRASKKSNSFPNWVQGKTLPHYHRGKGNNLHRHRPWEIGWSDINFWDRF